MGLRCDSASSQTARARRPALRAFSASRWSPIVGSGTGNKPGQRGRVRAFRPWRVEGRRERLTGARHGVIPVTFARLETFRSIGQTLAADVLPALYRSQKLPLRISCLGIAGYDASEAANSFDRVIRLGECPSPEEAIQAAALRLSRGDICTGRNSFPYFQPRIMLIQDRDQRLVLAGEVRASIILWQQPVASDAEAHRIVTEASRLRGMAFRTRAHAEARALRWRAAVLEARLVDPFWRETSAHLLRLPQAA